MKYVLRLKRAMLSKRQTLLLTLIPILVMALFVFVAIGCSPSGASSNGNGANGASTNAESGTGGSGGTVAAGGAYDWSMKSDCTVCHTTEASDSSDSKHVQAVAHESLTCTTCHTEESILSKSHDGISLTDKPATKPSVLTVNEKTCVSCHGDLSEVAKLTTDSTALKDDKGLVVNPHQRPEGATHSQNPATCTDCHDNHSETLARDAKKYCASCHHRGVWQCGTCHENRS